MAASATSPSASMVTRFAPSPSGELHLGHAYSALFAFDRAREAGGSMLLRIEDIDVGRCRPEFEAAIHADLDWLGLAWPTPVRRQSDHMADYAAALKRLEALDLLYPCFCTRKDIREEIQCAGRAPHLRTHGPDGPIYPGTCRRLSDAERRQRLDAGIPHALRLDMARASERAGRLTWRDRTRGPQLARPELFGDVVLARKDVATSYHLAVTVDDALQGVTLATRGEDLLPATHIHRLLQALLDLAVPEWLHHPLLTGADGKRFAKRDRSLTLRALRDAGHHPDAVRAMAERNVEPERALVGI